MGWVTHGRDIVMMNVVVSYTGQPFVNVRREASGCVSCRGGECNSFRLESIHKLRYSSVATSITSFFVLLCRHHALSNRNFRLYC